MKNNSTLYSKSSDISLADQKPELPKSLGISNVSEGKPWHIPDHPSRKFRVSNLKANRYLNLQWRRLSAMIRTGEVGKAFLVFSHLARRSTCLRVFFMNRVAKGWYHSMSRAQVLKLMHEITKILGHSRSDVRIYRFYLPKPDGRKRPIGAPTLAWRVVIAMWTDFLYMVINPRISDNHHGFRPKRGLLTAWEAIWEKYEKIDNPVVYELDLDGFFNNIHMGKALEILQEYGAPVWWIRWFDWANAAYPLIHKNVIQPEKELTVDAITTDQIFGTTRYNPVSRKGGPQGAAWSPLLAVMTLDYAMKKFNIWDLIWYADDALGISRTLREWHYLLSIKAELAAYGIVLSDKKKKDGNPATGVVNDEVTFVGLTWDPIEDMVLIDGIWKDRKKVSVKELQVAVWSAYEGRGKPWRWETKYDSLLFDLILSENKLQFERTGIWIDPYCMEDKESNNNAYTELIQEKLWGKASHTWISSIACHYLKELWDRKGFKKGDKDERQMDIQYSSDLAQRRENRMIPMTTGVDLSRRNKPIRKIGRRLLQEQRYSMEVLRKEDALVNLWLRNIKRYYRQYEKLHMFKYLATIVEKRRPTANSYELSQSIMVPLLGIKVPGHNPAFYNRKFWGIQATPQEWKQKTTERTTAYRLSRHSSNLKQRIAAISLRVAANLEKGKDLSARLEREVASSRKI